MDNSGIVTVLESKAKVYSAVAGSLTGQTLAFNTQWKYNLTSTDSQGKNWFHVGGSQWVCETEVGVKIQSAVHTSGTLKSNGAFVRVSPNGSGAGFNLTAQESYQYDTKVIDAWGYTWYHVGFANWVAGLDVNLNISGVVTVTESKAKVYSSVNGSATGQTLSFNTQWKYNLVAIDGQGRNWYHVGGSQWVCETEVGNQLQSLTHVSGTLSSNGAVVYHAPQGSGAGFNLTAGESYKYDTKAIDVNGNAWYHVGFANWVSANDVILASSKPGNGARVKVTFYDPAVLGSSMGYGGVAANLNVYPKGTNLKIVLDQPVNGQTVLYRQVNDTGTFVNQNPNQIDIALPNSQIPAYGVTYATIYVL